MANYNCAVRINYFKVKDEKAFLSLMEKAQGGEDGIQVFTLENKDQGRKNNKIIRLWLLRRYLRIAYRRFGIL